MEGKEEMHPRPKAQRRGRARGEPHRFRVEGAGVCTSRPLVSQPVQGGGGGRTGLQGWGEEKSGWGEPAGKLPASFRLNKSCTFLLAPPRGSSPPQKTSFCSFTPKKVFLDTFSSFYSLLQRARPSQPTLPRTGGGGFRTASAGAAAAAGVGRGLVEETGAAGPWVVPPREEEGKASYSPLWETFSYSRALAKWDVPMLPAFFASKIVVRNKRRAHTFHSQKKN